MAMQNLRDKLLKAGLVDKKQKQQVDTQDRREKKQKSIDTQVAEDAERQRQFAERQAAEKEAQQKLEAERAAERDRHEQQNRVRNICDRWAARSNKPGVRRFYFVRRTSYIGHIKISEPQYDQLLQGALAVVERTPDDEQHVLLPPEAAERVYEIDPAAIRFWARRTHPIGFIAEPEGAELLSTGSGAGSGK